MNSNKQIKYGAIISYIGIVVNILTGLLYTPWLIRTIGKDDYGLYTLSLSIISLFVFDFGLSAAVQRFVAKYLAVNNEQKVNDCLGLVYKLYIYIDIVLLVILTAVYFFIPSIYKELLPDEIEKFKVIYIISASFSIFSFPFIPLGGVISAYEKFVQLKICDLFHKIFIVITMTICLLYGLGLYALVSVNAISGILTILLKLYVVKRYTNANINFSYSNKTEFKDILNFSGWTTVIALSQRCIFNIVPTILGMFTGSASIAVIGIAMNLEAYTFMYASAINGMFLSKVSRIVSKDGSGDVLPLMIKVGRLQLFMISIIFIGFIIIGKDFITLWLGNNFEEVYICTLLLIIPSFFALPQDIADQAIIAQNKVKYRARVYLFVAILNLIMAIPLAMYYGVIGVSFSIFISYMVRTICMNIVYYKVLNIDVFSFIKVSFFRIFPGLLVAFILSYVLCSFISIEGWIGLGLRVLIIGVVYILSIGILSMKKDEIHIFIGNLKK
jgi:O-antigen/teichoic acid export membrane protein